MTNHFARSYFAVFAINCVRPVLLMIAMSVPGSATATTVVLACSNDFGSSDGCNNGTPGGCYVATWETIATIAVNSKLKVKTDASHFWEQLSTLKPTDNVAVSSQTAGSAASCAQVTGMASVASLAATQPAPPTPIPVPNSTPGSLTTNWTASTLNTDGSRATVINYRVICSGPTPVNQLTGNVTTFTASNLAAGNYSCTISAIDAAGSESARSNPATVTVVGAIPTPIPQPTISIVEVLGSWTLKKGTTNVRTGLVDYAACKAAAIAKATSTATKYFCSVSNAVTVKQ